MVMTHVNAVRVGVVVSTVRNVQRKNKKRSDEMKQGKGE